jgi:hypothetical protein
MSDAGPTLQRSLSVAAGAVTESSDLLDRVQSSIADDRRLRAQHRRRAGIGIALAGAVIAVSFATSQSRQGELIMDWWVLELMSVAGLVALALWLGPFIRRFGKSYAADVFRSNPRTGKSFVVLMDVAYYLVFFAYILFTVQFEPAAGWEQTVNASQLRGTTVRFGGILLIVGLLHGLNVITLPLMGRLMSLNRHLDDSVERTFGNDT